MYSIFEKILDSNLFSLASTLHADLTKAKRLFLLKRKAFAALCKLYADKVSKWNMLDRTTRTMVKKEVECVYHQHE